MKFTEKVKVIRISEADTYWVKVATVTRPSSTVFIWRVFYRGQARRWGYTSHISRKKFLLVLSVLSYFSFPFLFFIFIIPSYLNCWDAWLSVCILPEEAFYGNLCFSAPILYFFPFGIFPKGTLAIILSVYSWFTTFFLYISRPSYFLELHINIPNSKTKNKQQKRNNSNNVLPLIAAGIAVTTHCHVYKGTHGICYWLAPNLILNKRTCYSSQFFPWIVVENISPHEINLLGRHI